MASLLQRAVRRARRTLGKDYVVRDGTVLPPPDMRYNGREFRDDAYFLQSAINEADRLAGHPGLSPRSVVLEVGGGPGRLPIGLIHTDAPLERFEGVDIDAPAMQWCTRHLSRSHPKYRFSTINVRHDRYNPDAPPMGEGFRLPFGDHTFDIIYLHSVFANLLEPDVRVYVREFSRLLRPDGRVFLTMFIEDEVPPVTVNPDDYLMQIRGALHIVRWEREYLFRVFEEAGLEVERFAHGSGLGGQSELYLSPST